MLGKHFFSTVSENAGFVSVSDEDLAELSVGLHDINFQQQLDALFAWTLNEDLVAQNGELPEISVKDNDDLLEGSIDKAEQLTDLDPVAQFGDTSEDLVPVALFGDMPKDIINLIDQGLATSEHILLNLREVPISEGHIASASAMFRRP